MNEVTLFTIRPLKWASDKSAYMETHRAEVPMGRYTVERNREEFDESKPWEPWRWTFLFDEYYDEGREECKTLSEGKQKAFAHWISRITPALAPFGNSPATRRPKPASRP